MADISGLVALDSVDHADLRLKALHGTQCGDPGGQVAVFVSEFEALQRDYPIMFLRTAEGDLQPVALLGFSGEENLFIEAGRWQARAIPALVRRGPFRFAMGDAGEPTIMVDLNSPRIAAEGEDGAPVFREHGGQAPSLDNAVDALRQIHSDVERTRQAMQQFDRLALVEPIRVNIRLSDHDVVKLENFHGITMERVSALSPQELGELNAKGLLAPAVLAASSLGNIGNMLAMRKRPEA